ncbi:MAG: carbohydrate kinase family protein [Candidatus Peregrinibacteria bacterium]|nr:carbohydrate kinase family protein [Candidatus Peregrinibacteria bacterium]
MRILVTGSIAYDLLLSYDGSFASAIDPKNIEALSLAFVTPHFAKHHGGTGANISWTLALLGQSPLLVGTVGNDGGTYTALLEERGVRTDHIEKLQDAATSTAILATDSAERQIIFYHPGADAKGTWPDLADDRDDLGYAIISPREVKMMIRGAEWCREFGVPYLFDPGQQLMALSTDELKRTAQAAAGVITNAYEWGLLSDRLRCSTDDFLEWTKYLIVTHSEEGLTLYTKGSTLVVPACKADRVVNPTGAGDALRAGLLTGLAAKWPLPIAARLGASVASFVVEQEGTLLDSLDLNAVLGRAEVTYGEMLPELP